MGKTEIINNHHIEGLGSSVKSQIKHNGTCKQPDKTINYELSMPFEEKKVQW